MTCTSPQAHDGRYHPDLVIQLLRATTRLIEWNWAKVDASWNESNTTNTSCVGCGGTGGDVEPICSRPSDAASADVLVDALCDASSLRGGPNDIKWLRLNHTKTAKLWYSAVGSAPEMSYLRIHDRIARSARAYRWKDVLFETLATCYHFWKSDTTTSIILGRFQCFHIRGAICAPDRADLSCARQWVPMFF